MASYVIEGPAVLYCGAATCDANQYNASSAGTLLGITESGVSISTSLMTHRISTDVYGGTEGPPAELVVLGGQASVRGTLVQWSTYALGLLTQGLRGAAEAGEIPWPGVGVWSGGHGFAFWVVGALKAYYFPRCELATQPREWNISALERKMSLNINAYSTSTNHIYFTDSTTSDTNRGNIAPSCNVTVV